MPTDVFLRVAPQSWLRTGLAIACIEAWKLQKEPLNLRSIAAGGIVGAKEISSRHPFETVLPFENFHWTSRIYADENATSDPYFMCDDDRIPMSFDWLKRAVEHWRFYNQHHTYAMLVDVSALKVERYCDAPEFVASTQPCMESTCWAGPNLATYKGAIDYHQFHGAANQQDLEIEAWARKNGVKQAVMKDVCSNHAGVSFSQAEPKLWGRY